jgi:bacterial polymer biosynthesis proteins, WecB/TagA/CpsF family
MMNHSEKIDVLGVEFDNITMDEAVDYAMELISRHQSSYVVTPNPEIVWMCRTDENLKDAVTGASMVLADGIGIIYGAKILKTPLKEKIPGTDFAARLIDELAKRSGSVYLLGSKPGVADGAAEKMKKEHPGLVISGTHDGYFKEDKAIIDDINSKKPDFLLVCLGAPKQENWMKKNSAYLDVGIMAGLGGTLDVYAGTVKRAPEKWQKLGLEWLYRLLKEPKRISRTMKLPLFVFAVIGARFNRKKR